MTTGHLFLAVLPLPLNSTIFAASNSMIFSKGHKNKITAAFLLVTFLLAITPKLFVHGLFASHVENVLQHHSRCELSKAGYNCQCEDQVAESVFEGAAVDVIIHCQPTVASHVELITGTVNIPTCYTHLRGPPAV
jgi:hypothetical protein